MNNDLKEIKAVLTVILVAVSAILGLMIRNI